MKPELRTACWVILTWDSGCLVRKSGCRLDNCRACICAACVSTPNRICL